MTKDDITTMARNAGFVGMDGNHGALRRFAEIVSASERARCCGIVFGQCGSDNVAQRTVDAILKMENEE